MSGVAEAMLRAWAAGRSLARGLPPPVPDRGGIRIDTRSDTETCRWIFAQACPAVADLARSISIPGYPIKVCADADVLTALLPAGWTVRPTGFFMIADTGWADRALPSSYRTERERLGEAVMVRIVAADGTVAASGWAAETREAFVYDRIVTDAAHRRRGLGGALMSALRDARRDAQVPDLLVATPAGRALYETLGWRALSPYATATVEPV